MKKLLLAMAMFFISIGVVNAKTLTIEEISNKINSEGTFTTVVDSSNNSIDLNLSGNKLLTLKYTDSYIFYEDNRTPITEEMANEQLAVYIGLASVMDAVNKLSGVVDKKLPEESNIPIETDEFFNTYGVLMRSEEYSFTSEHSTSSGDFVRLFKYSLDTEKIYNFYEQYGVKDTDPMADVKPVITAKDVTSSSVKLEVSSTATGTSSVFCDIYRSTSENGEYVKINDVAVVCDANSHGIIIEDKNLNADTTYFYKAKTQFEGSKFGDVIQVRTLAVPTPTKNPKTGVEDYLLPISLIIVFSFIGITIANKLSYIKM